MPNDVTCERLTCECLPELNLYVYGLNRRPPVEYDQTTRLWVCPPGFVCTIDDTETGPCPTCGGPPPPVIIPSDDIPEDDGGVCWTCLADDTDFINQKKGGFNRLRPTRTIANQQVTARCLNLAVPQEGSASYTIPAGTIRIPWPRNPNPQVDLQVGGQLQLQVNAQALQLAIARLEIDLANGVQQCEETDETGDPVPTDLLVVDGTVVDEFTTQYLSFSGDVDVAIAGSNVAGKYKFVYLRGALNDDSNPCPTFRAPLSPEVEWFKHHPFKLRFRYNDLTCSLASVTSSQTLNNSFECTHTQADLEAYLQSQVGCDPLSPTCQEIGSVETTLTHLHQVNLADPPGLVCRTEEFNPLTPINVYYDNVTFRVTRTHKWLRTWAPQMEITNWAAKVGDFRPPGEANTSVAPAWGGQFITSYLADVYYYCLNTFNMNGPSQGLQWYGYAAADIVTGLTNSIGGKALYSPQCDWAGTTSEPDSPNGCCWYLTLFCDANPGMRVPIWTGRKNWGTTPLGTYTFFDSSTSFYYGFTSAFGKLNDVVAASSAPLPANTRTGNDLDANVVGALPAFDGVTVSVGQRVCVREEGNPINNGIYTVANAGSAVTLWKLTRATDFNPAAAPLQGKWFKVTSGASFGDKFLQLTTVDPFTINTNAVNFELIVDDLVVAAL